MDLNDWAIWVAPLLSSDDLDHFAKRLCAYFCFIARGVYESCLPGIYNLNSKFYIDRAMDDEETRFMINDCRTQGS